jgi:hypothetical protein
MGAYRVYIMDSMGRHIEDCASISASSDADAIQAAERRHDRHPSELWLRDRLVRAFPSHSAM